jgi:hypothetical protein
MFYRIECLCEKKRGSTGKPRFLGDIQVTVPNTAHHHCPHCNTTYEHTVDEHGIITRKIITDRINYTESLVRVGR